MSGYDVDLAELDTAAQAIAQTMHDMKTCAVNRIDGAAPQYGHAGLHDAMSRFCDRWHDGVDLLLKDSATIVTALNGSVDAYSEADQSAEESMRAIGAGVDPAVEVADG